VARVLLPHNPLLSRYQNKLPSQAPKAEPGTGHHRSKAIALILALLLGPLGAHRFYLGYYGQGALYLGLTALTTFFALLSLLSLLTVITSLSVFLAIAIILSLAIDGWLLSDIARILSNDLQPKDGEYL
jgi:TM2 domain-containing membrane protein YozV